LRLSRLTRRLLVGVPVLLVAVLLLVNLTVGVTAGVLLVGVAAATATFVKNRTDRHNAAVDRGEIRVPPDPGLRPADVGELPPGLLPGLARFEIPAADIARVTRFEGGWLVRPRQADETAVVAGDDGGWARYDPRLVTDLWAATEYRAGRGREPQD
jgi:hypothetical protein